MEIDLATAWEIVGDALPQQEAIIQGSRRITYRDFDDVASRFASALEAAGVTQGGKVALYLYNCPEYLFSEFGAFKHRAVPVNVNYRYLDDELAYLIDNSDAEALVFHSSLGDRVGRVRDKLPNLKLLVEVDDDGTHLEGTSRFDELIDSHEPQARQTRSGQDMSMTYTGGTTGMPKGVMSRQGPYVEGVYRVTAALLGMQGEPTEAAQITEVVQGLAAVGRNISVPCCPLMHATGLGICAIPTLLRGGTIVLLEQRSFDPHELWSLAEREGITVMVIVGDAFARPMLRALEDRERDGRPYDTSSVRDIVSAGTIWSAEIKDGLSAKLTARLTDMLGSTEGGIYAVSNAGRDAHVETAKFGLSVGTRVITEDGRDVVAGSGERGLIASASVAFGYYKDPEKSATTFRELDGKSYVLTGDWATVELDGTVTLLGRGSNCINSGGEKIFPEEVEEAVKRHPGVDDCLVVGMPDERFGQCVVAVVGSSTASPPSDVELREWLRPSLSHFKVPKSFIVLDAVRRAPNGKADYGWAKEQAAKVLAP
jgi:3-oxocholest-4-en-26-oate---CoA ligase